MEQPVQVKDLLADLAPPKHFANATFQNYRPDARFPSQKEAVQELKRFVHHRLSRSGGLIRLFRSNRSGKGLYLDGGFGVGKTHLLAASYHAIEGSHSDASSNRCAFLSFQELMFLVGLQGLNKTAETFRDLELLIIDEFELDDPANTRIATNLLGQLIAGGVQVLTSSNTPPGALGEGKFSVEGFRRELGALFHHFQSIRIEGEDYRLTHRAPHTASSSWVIGEEPPVLPRGHNTMRVLALPFDGLLETLALAHPIRVRKALFSFDAVVICNVQPIQDPHAALRFVYFVDKAYDDNLELSASSSVPVRELFSHSIFHGGDTKKYLRAISRLEEMTHSA